MKHCLVTLAAAAAVVLGSAGPAAAQASATTANPTFDLGAAYQFLYMNGDGDGKSLPLGLAVDAARYWGTLGLAAEAGWARESSEFEPPSVFTGLSAETNVFHAGVGPRFAARSAGRVRPYAQVLVGASAVRNSIEGDGDTETAFMIQPGAGVNLVMGDGWSLFGDAAYRRSFFDVGLNEVRVLIGARMILD